MLHFLDRILCICLSFRKQGEHGPCAGRDRDLKSGDNLKYLPSLGESNAHVCPRFQRAKYMLKKKTVPTQDPSLKTPALFVKTRRG